MSDALKVNLQQVEDLIKGLDSSDQLELLNSLKNQPSDGIVDINKAKASLLDTTPSNEYLGKTNITLGDLEAANQAAKMGIDIKDDSVLKRLGTDEGLMGFYDKALQSRKNDRILEGIGVVGNMFNRMALINKL